MTSGERSQQRRDAVSNLFQPTVILTGFAAGQALAAGVFAFSVGFGVLATEAGLSSLKATLMSVVFLRDRAIGGTAKLAR